MALAADSPTKCAGSVLKHIHPGSVVPCRKHGCSDYSVVQLRHPHGDVFAYGNVARVPNCNTRLLSRSHANIKHHVMSLYFTTGSVVLLCKLCFSPRLKHHGMCLHSKKFFCRSTISQLSYSFCGRLQQVNGLPLSLQRCMGFHTVLPSRRTW